MLPNKFLGVALSHEAGSPPATLYALMTIFARLKPQ